MWDADPPFWGASVPHGTCGGVILGSREDTTRRNR